MLFNTITFSLVLILQINRHHILRTELLNNFDLTRAFNVNTRSTADVHITTATSTGHYFICCTRCTHCIRITTTIVHSARLYKIREMTETSAGFTYWYNWILLQSQLCCSRNQVYMCRWLFRCCRLMNTRSWHHLHHFSLNTALQEACNNDIFSAILHHILCILMQTAAVPLSAILLMNPDLQVHVTAPSFPLAT